jgi:hypothetical protein
MKQQEAEQIINDARCQFRRAEAELDCKLARPDGNGYRVVILWTGRRVVLKNSKQWASLRQAWQVLNERG